MIEIRIRIETRSDWNSSKTSFVCVLANGYRVDFAREKCYTMDRRVILVRICWVREVTIL